MLARPTHAGRILLVVSKPRVEKLGLISTKFWGWEVEALHCRIVLWPGRQLCQGIDQLIDLCRIVVIGFIRFWGVRLCVIWCVWMLWLAWWGIMRCGPSVVLILEHLSDLLR